MGDISSDDDPEYAAYITSQRYLQRRQTVPATLEKGTGQDGNKSIAESLKKAWKDYFSKKDPQKTEVKRFEKEKENRNDSPRTFKRRIKLRQSSATEEDLLHFAISRDDIKAVRNILEKSSVEINAMRPPGVSALHQASAVGNTQCIQLLIDHGADLEVKTWQGQSALQVAAKYGNFEAAELLIQYGANMDEIRDGI